MGELVKLEIWKVMLPLSVTAIGCRAAFGADDFWRLLSEREIIQESVTDRYGRGLNPSVVSVGRRKWPVPMRA